MIVNKEPHPSVVKEVICRNCGVTLSYIPLDIVTETLRTYDGYYDFRKFIVCPSCTKQITV